MLTLALDVIEEMALIDLSSIQRKTWEVKEVKTYRIIITTGNKHEKQDHIFLISAHCLDDAIADARDELGERGLWISGQVVEG